jgi:hypothetical protein
MNTGEERRINKRWEAKRAKEGQLRGDWMTGRVRSGSRVAHRRTGRSAHRASDGYERLATRINELRDRVNRLERAAHLNERRDSEAQVSAWYTYAGVEALLEIIQIACPTAFPDAVAFLREQIEVHQPAGDDPAPEEFAEFKARRKAAAK